MKEQLIEVIHKAGLTKKASQELYMAIQNIVVETTHALKVGERVNVFNLLSATKIHIGEKTYPKLINMERPVTKPEHDVVKIKPYGKLRKCPV